MTAFTTHCCRNSSLAAILVALCLAASAAFLAPAAGAAQPGGIEIRSASLVYGEDGHTLSADVDISLTPVLEDALNKGVSLYFVLELEILRTRWYWFNEKMVSTQQQIRLTYNTLTRQYRVGSGALYQNFSTLSEAFNFLSKVRRRVDIESGAFKRDGTYSAALRMRLDVAQLPKPFQLNALGSREWNLTSEWYRWTVAP